MLGTVIALAASLLLPASREASHDTAAPHAKRCEVRVASALSRVAPRALEMKNPERVLRGDFETSLGRIDCSREKIDHTYDVMAELVAAESVNGRDRVTSSVTVKAIVRDGSGAMLAVVQGKARGEDRSNARASLERDLLKAAADEASRSVPEAIRRARGTR
jgi:hypothetical protein